MAVSLANIPKESLVYKFITSGKRGRCSFCSKMVEKLEAHHVCYDPEKTIKLCHHCHHRVHYWPQRLSEAEITKLLVKRFPFQQVLAIIKEKRSVSTDFSHLFAPSRAGFVRKLAKRPLKQH